MNFLKFILNKRTLGLWFSILFICLLTLYCVWKLALGPSQLYSSIRKLENIHFNISKEQDITLPLSNGKTRPNGLFEDKSAVKNEVNLSLNSDVRPDENSPELLHGAQTGKNKQLVFTREWGRLGNHFVAFANLFAVADSANLTVAVPKNEYLLLRSAFQLQDVVVFDEDYLPFPHLDGFCTDNSSVSWQLPLLASSRILNLIWELADHHCFDRQESLIRKNFELKEVVLKQCSELFRRHLAEHHSLHNLKNTSEDEQIHETITIGIHTRRGDIENGTRRGRVPSSAAFIEKAIHHILNRNAEVKAAGVANVLFLMFGDDRTWNLQFVQSYYSSKNSDKFPNRRWNLTFLVPDNGDDPVMDFCQLTLCNQIIISTGSTFSFWAAYLAGRSTPVYYPQYYHRKDSKVFVQHPVYMMPYWIMIS